MTSILLGSREGPVRPSLCRATSFLSQAAGSVGPPPSPPSQPASRESPLKQCPKASSPDGAGNAGEREGQVFVNTSPARTTWKTGSGREETEQRVPPTSDTWPCQGLHLT